MFQKTSPTAPSQKLNPSVKDKLNFDQKKDFKIDEIPIHTMKEDLKNLSNPNFKVDTSIPEKTEMEKTSGDAAASKENPFLSQQNWIKEERPKPEENKPIHHTLGKLTLVAVTILIFLAIAGGGYYFWITRTDKNQPAETISLPPVSPAESLPSFALDKPNYLSLDTENDSSDQIKTSLNDYASKVSKIKTVLPVEFIITDANNNPINFPGFAQKLSLTFSESLLSQLGSDFSLYLYNDQDKIRMGISVSVKEDESQLKALLTEEEKNLIKELEPLYLAPAYTLEDKAFSSAAYNTAAIRYVNIISPEDLSVDYTVYNNQLVIGTTKMTLRSIIDYIDQQNSQPENYSALPE